MSQELTIDYSRFKDNDFPNRYTKHNNLKARIEQIGSKGIFKVKEAGRSVQQREIYQLTIGMGNTNVMLSNAWG